ncbi:Trm112 family protein [Geothrix sp. 21YS21S-2]|uniref:Trm112 family protein n=1 Tax=Geothrix sp. 21YS21S-2 TaxID=3068893 RepID=UPI0027B88B77|nr:Trm112 family protein [Geothrix sp. 21YS21S-2]
MLDPRLLEILCCPAVDGDTACHGDLAETPAGLACARCGRVYPVEDGIPVMLQDKAAKEAR